MLVPKLLIVAMISYCFFNILLILTVQCSCLENPRDGEAWWAAVSGIAQRRTWLKRLSSSSSSSVWDAAFKKSHNCLCSFCVPCYFISMKWEIQLQCKNIHTFPSNTFIHTFPLSSWYQRCWEIVILYRAEWSWSLGSYLVNRVDHWDKKILFGGLK